jgi:hypothetical protein
VKIDNLYQDPESDSDAPYADTLIIDAGGLDVKYGGETVAHVSFEDVDPFEIAFHAVPDDWEPHREYEFNAKDDTLELFDLTRVQLAENAVNRALLELGEAQGWERA